MSSYLSVQYDPARVPVGNPYPGQLIRYLIARLRLPRISVLPGDLKLLELGPGRGDFLKAWKTQGFETHAIDRETPGAIRADLERDTFPWADSTFDVVFSKNVVEHMQSPVHMLTEARRVLKPGGRLIVMTPEAKAQGMHFWEDYTHVRPFDRISLPDAASAAGLKVQLCEELIQFAPVWWNPLLLPLAALSRMTLTLDAARWLTRRTGWGLFRWAREPSLLLVATKN